MNLVVIVVTLAGCFNVPLASFLINKGTLQHGEHCLLSRILTCPGEPELLRNPCLPSKRLFHK